MKQTGLPPKAEIEQIMSLLFSDFIRDNPYNFVMMAFPWGQKGFPLEKEKGPREWQKRELLAIAEHIKLNKERVKQGLNPILYKLAVASGRGIGKSTLVSWIILWLMSCHYGSTTIISANTDDQISNKTFGEIGRWRTMMLNSFFFDQTQKNLSPAVWYEKILKDEMKIDTTYYYARGVLWDPDRPDAFAGAHSSIGMAVIFDEASGIDESIWTVTQGFFTDNTIYRFWLAFSNPRSGAGAFFDCFNDDGSTWNIRNINALEIEGIDHSELEDIIRKNGSDSDPARVEVYGQFPRAGDRQFISRALVDEASKRELERYDNNEPLVLGIDPARFGSDKTVFWFRQGRDARSIPPQEYQGLDNMQIVDKVTQAIHTFNPDAIFIDSGAGAGIIDRLKQLGYKVHEVLFGSVSGEQHLYDHRTELWSKMRDWLTGGMIPVHKQLKNDLCNPQKELIGRESKEKLESKENMKKRGIKSPDYADALALTFHAKIARKDHLTSRKGKTKKYRNESSNILD